MSETNEPGESSLSAALRLSEERLRLVQSVAGIGSIVWDLIENRVWRSPEYLALHGLPLDAPAEVGWSDVWLDRLHPDDRESVRAGMAESAARPGDFEREYRICRVDTGEERWLYNRGRTEADADGRPVRMIAAQTDITERKRAELRHAFLLRLSDVLGEAESARAATETAARLIAEKLRADGIGFMEMNPEGGEAWLLSGYGKTADRFVHRPLRIGREGPFRGASLADTAFGRTFVLRSLADDPRTAGDAEAIRKATRTEAAIHVPLMRAGRLRALLFVHSDRPRDWTTAEVELAEAAAARVSEAIERMRAEDAVLRANEALAEQVTVAVAARETALSQLHQAQKLETIGQLTGGIAHDFNNLLTPITGALDILAHRFGDDPRLARLIGGALQSAERARTLVQRLLGFARRQPLRPAAVNVAGLLDGMRDLITSSVGPQIALSLEAAEDLPRAMADLNQLELALLNLCVNARDAMREGGALTIAARAEDLDPANMAGLKPGRYVRLSVADTGIGMDAETCARAIEPFFSTKAKERGTGLGLSMVHGLAAQLGGGLAIASAPGEGTRIDLWLPVARTGTRAPEAAAAKSPVALRPLSLLLVDDEHLVRTATAEMLRDLGHHVDEASGAREALAQLQGGQRYDAVVTDYMMPDVDGVELARRIDAMAPGMPVLLVTGYMGLAEGAGDLPRLAKPFGRDAINACLARLVAVPA